MASKGTGGGLISQTTHGKTEFVAPGSMNVQAEGKSIQQLGDMMTNNGSNPSNGGMTPKEMQDIQMLVDALTVVAKACSDKENDDWDKNHPNGPKHTDCEADLGEFMDPDDPVEVKKVQVKLGELKEKCVNDTLGQDPGILRSQEAFDPDGTPKGKAKPFGSARTKKGEGFGLLLCQRPPDVIGRR